MSAEMDSTPAVHGWVTLSRDFRRIVLRTERPTNDSEADDADTRCIISARNFSRFCYWLASLRINASDAGVACRRRAKCAVLAFSSKFFFFVYVVNNSRMEPLANNFIVALKDSSFQPLLPNFLKCVWNNCHHYPAFQSFLLLGGVAQWLGRQPLPGGISLIFAWTMVNT